MFDNLAKAKAGALHKLLSKLPVEEAAIVLTNLPNQLAIQIIAHYPGETQTEIGPAMVDARWVEPEKTKLVEAKIRAMLQQAKQNLAAKNIPGAPVARPASPQFGKAGNPYQTAQTAQTAPPPAEKRTAEKHKNEPPKPWIPRQATASPINGPALPGTPPPVAGDPFASPLAKAGLLDLIGRAQEKLFPKNAPKSAAQNTARNTPLRTRKSAPAGIRTPDKHGRPEPTEGVPAPNAARMVKTPRLIGSGAPKQGARHMDGKAILAAILRESTPDIRGTVRHDDPSLFKQLRDRMFYFDDLALTDDNALARVFTAAPAGEAALALKFAAPALRKKVLRAVSPGRARALEEHAAGRAGLDAVEKAQQTVLDVALQLQSAGRILIDPRDPDLAGK